MIRWVDRGAFFLLWSQTAVHLGEVFDQVRRVQSLLREDCEHVEHDWIDYDHVTAVMHDREGLCGKLGTPPVLCPARVHEVLRTEDGA